MPQQSKPDLAVGDAVAARFGGGPDFYFGEITAVLDDGTYNISYADGDHEEGVKRLRIKGKEDQMPTVLVEGMRCEARHGGSMRAFDGVISKVNSDGTYDVGYDDGDKETGVARELIYVQAVAEPSWSAKSDGSFSPEATEAIHRIFATFNASASSEGKWGMAEFNAFQEALAEDPMQTEEEFSGVCGSLEVSWGAAAPSPPNQEPPLPTTATSPPHLAFRPNEPPGQAGRVGQGGGGGAGGVVRADRRSARGSPGARAAWSRRAPGAGAEGRRSRGIACTRDTSPAPSALVVLGSRTARAENDLPV